MAIIKCKMCGGDLVIEPGSSVAECESCGRRQTVPTADNEKKLTLFARANRLRSGCEFDKAAGIYESIVADFPQEAEAYWGLVLCKYGIEYVDDPATGKKIPTCHRSSFDSVLEDSDFDQACENADTVAQKVYREEAKEFERIRKGILEVSSTEKPYDIFICYKETDEKGDRTLDSVLAQDLYTALTDKGYRVFFSRVTLRDKLGQAYEPYIFAALNSAKIMLAFGTDYEYFNAVWVKNEWSRYLKLMAADKSKHLIPCYKNIDAYDMPREFAKLQAQDMGKVGAIQDLLRGIEKLLPKKETLIQERVVVEAPAANGKIASLLDRGYMALEDGDYDKADGFFEEVLNNDSKNAQAYIGKALAEEEECSLDALVRQWLQSTESAKPETLSLEPEETHIEKAVQDYTIAGYLGPDAIRKAYHFDLSYPSTVSVRQQQYQKTKAQWENHQWLTKAEKFASDQEAQKLAAAKKTLFDALDQRLSDSRAEEEAKKKPLRQRYEAFLVEKDREIEELYRQKLAKKEAVECYRENRYQELVPKLETARTIEALHKLEWEFKELGDYRDSATHAKTCEESRNALLAQKAVQEKAKKKRKRALILICLLLIAAAAAVVKLIVIPALDYQNAVKLMEQGSYEKAVLAFSSLGDYRDARQHSMELWNIVAQRDTISAGEYHTVGLRADGTVVAEGRDKYSDDDYIGQCWVSYWKDIVAISAGRLHTVGLKADGTVEAVGEYKHGQCRVSDWKDIVAISAGAYHTVGLKANGTVVAVGSNKDYEGNHIGQCDVSNWKDIVAISAGWDHTVGLKADGTVVAVGDNDYGQCNVSGWKDIVAVSAGNFHTVGLKADGTVVAVGNNKDNEGNHIGQCDVSDWQDIVAISAGYYHTIGLKADGAVVAVGDNDYGQCNVSDWKDIVAISAGWDYTVGLKADGTLVAVGDNDDGQCDVGGWSDIKIPAKP